MHSADVSGCGRRLPNISRQCLCALSPHKVVLCWRLGDFAQANVLGSQPVAITAHSVLTIVLKQCILFEYCRYLSVLALIITVGYSVYRQ